MFRGQRKFDGHSFSLRFAFPANHFRCFSGPVSRKFPLKWPTFFKREKKKKKKKKKNGAKIVHLQFNTSILQKHSLTQFLWNPVFSHCELSQLDNQVIRK